MMKRPLKILIANKVPAIRYGLRKFLEEQDGIKVVSDADSFESLVMRYREKKPDVLIIDTEFLENVSIDYAVNIISEKKLKILAFNSNESWDKVQAFLEVGGLGFISKRSELSEILTAVKAVAENKQWISPSVRQVLNEAKTTDNELELTHREKEISVLVARGFTSKQIAEQLCISINTVESHRRSIFKKLHINTNIQLTNHITRLGLL